jgi:hypothetical protein
MCQEREKEEERFKKLNGKGNIYAKKSGAYECKKSPWGINIGIGSPL